MATATKIDKDGKELGSVTLDDAVFDVAMAESLVHEVAVALQLAQRQGNHETKTRKEVRGGGRKPFRQKGTGGARRGSTRDPILRGGGTVFGPHKRSYRQKVPVSFRRRALGCMLSDRVRSESVKVLDAFGVDAPSTSSFAAVVKNVAGEGGSTLFVTAELNRALVQSANNLDRVSVRTAADVNALDVLGAVNVVIEEGAIEELTRRVKKRREKVLS